LSDCTIMPLINIVFYVWYCSCQYNAAQQYFRNHHQIILFLVEHMTSMKSFQALRSPGKPLTSFNDLLCFLSHHLLFDIPLLLYPWVFQSNAVFSIAPVSLHNVCPIQFHFLLFLWLSINFWRVIFHSSSFVILSVHFIFIILPKHLFTNICSLLVIWLVVFQVSQAFDNTDFPFVLTIRILTSFDMLRFPHTGYSWKNTPFAFFILLATSSSVPPLSDTTIPGYTEDPTSSISVSSNLHFCILDILTLIPFVLFRLICKRTNSSSFFSLFSFSPVSQNLWLTDKYQSHSPDLPIFPSYSTLFPFP